MRPCCGLRGRSTREIAISVNFGAGGRAGGALAATAEPMRRRSVAGGAHAERSGHRTHTLLCGCVGGKWHACAWWTVTRAWRMAWRMGRTRPHHGEWGRERAQLSAWRLCTG